MSRRRSKSKVLYIKAVILLTCFLLLIRIFTLVLSKYETEATGSANVDIAFYLLNEDFQTMTLNLDSILPTNNEYVYKFSIGNHNDKKTAEIDLEYLLKIRTTTNLPITYTLYSYNPDKESEQTNIMTLNEIQKDEYETYFRIIETEKVKLKYKEQTTNYYKLVVAFPKTYNSIDYQNIIELIEITVNSNQVTT